jgi:hypothetical protein
MANVVLWDCKKKMSHIKVSKLTITTRDLKLINCNGEGAQVNEVVRNSTINDFGDFALVDVN